MLTQYKFSMNMCVEILFSFQGNTIQLQNTIYLLTKLSSCFQDVAQNMGNEITMTYCTLNLGI